MSDSQPNNLSKSQADSALSLDSAFLIFLLEGGRAFTNAPELLGDINPEAAVKVVDSSPHSIATIVSHLDYWQSWFLQGVKGELEDYPDSLGNTFFTIEANEWDALRTQFLANLNEIKELCSDADLLARSFSMGQALGGGHDKRSVGMTLLYSVILHNAHHYGQIITLRQLLSLWPPADGGIS